MNSSPIRVSKSLSLARPMLCRVRRIVDAIASCIGRPRWLPWLAALAIFGTALSPALAAGGTSGPATSATLYVSKLSLDKKPEPDDRPGAEAKLNYYCAEGLARLKQEDDAVRGASTWPLQACTEDRFLSHKADDLRVVYVEWQDTTECAKSADVVVLVKETARKTAIAAGFSAVLKAGLAKASQKEQENGPAQRPWLCFTPFEQALVYDRAIADVSVSLKPAPDEKASKQLITGPTEHWFLSGDAIVKGTKELKYDPDKKAVFSRDKPEQLYLGINWMLGDVYSRYGWLAKERLVGKLMILPSRRPFDSVGVGIAYRFADGVFNADTGLQPTGGFMVFAGHFWTKNDAVDANGNATQDGRSRSWRVGVSYGLDSLLGWLK